MMVLCLATVVALNILWCGVDSIKARCSNGSSSSTTTGDTPCGVCGNRCFGVVHVIEHILLSRGCDRLLIDSTLGTKN